MEESALRACPLVIMLATISLKLMWGSKRWGNNEDNFLENSYPKSFMDIVKVYYTISVLTFFQRNDLLTFSNIGWRSLNVKYVSLPHSCLSLGPFFLSTFQKSSMLYMFTPQNPVNITPVVRIHHPAGCWAVSTMSRACVPTEWALSAPSVAPVKLPLYGNSHKHTHTHTHTQE